MKAWQTTALELYYAERRRDSSDVIAPDRPSRDHEWQNGAGWILPADYRDRQALRDIDSVSRLVFEVMWNHENRLRALEGDNAITRATFRNALINVWKQINP